MISNIIKEILSYVVKIIVILAAVVLIYRVAIWGYEQGYKLMAKQPSETQSVVNVELKIPKGSNTEQIANLLKEKKLINNVVYFRVMAKIKGMDSKFQYGTYTLNTGMDQESIMKVLATDGQKKEVVKFTIPEGFTADQIAARLVKKELIKNKKEFTDAIENINYGYKFLDDIPDRNLKLQGYLFPATYEVYKGATAEYIVSTMLKKFDEVFVDKYYARLKELNRSLDEIVIIASMIEKEVKVPEERPIVAGIIYNRLETAMNLEMCSTIMYALNEPRSRILLSDLEIPSPYNTYKNSGLPIGPIANPGEASLIAALYPEDNDYLFFVLTDAEKGSHEFNTTYNEHVKAKNKYNQKF